MSGDQPYKCYLYTSATFAALTHFGIHLSRHMCECDPLFVSS
jgi:hypothetical protein